MTFGYLQKGVTGNMNLKCSFGIHQKAFDIDSMPLSYTVGNVVYDLNFCSRCGEVFGFKRILTKEGKCKYES